MLALLMNNDWSVRDMNPEFVRERRHQNWLADRMAIRTHDKRAISIKPLWKPGHKQS